MLRCTKARLLYVLAALAVAGCSMPKPAETASHVPYVPQRSTKEQADFSEELEQARQQALKQREQVLQQAEDAP